MPNQENLIGIAQQRYSSHRCWNILNFQGTSHPWIHLAGKTGVPRSPEGPHKFEPSPCYFNAIANRVSISRIIQVYTDSSIAPTLRGGIWCRIDEETVGMIDLESEFEMVFGGLSAVSASGFMIALVFYAVRGRARILRSDVRDAHSCHPSR